MLNLPKQARVCLICLVAPTVQMVEYSIGYIGRVFEVRKDCELWNYVHAVCVIRRRNANKISGFLTFSNFSRIFSNFSHALSEFSVISSAFENYVPIFVEVSIFQNRAFTKKKVLNLSEILDWGQPCRCHRRTWSAQVFLFWTWKHFLPWQRSPPKGICSTSFAPGADDSREMAQ